MDGFVSAKQAMSQQQRQDSAHTMSHGSRATAGMSAATAEDDEANNSEADDSDSDSEEGEEQAAMHDIGDTPKELVTSSLVALYAEAMAFGAEWAATHGTSVQAAPSGSAASVAASAASAAFGATHAQGADGAQQPASQPFLGVPSLYDMTAAMVNDMFKPKQLLDDGVPELLVEEVYAAAGKGFRPLSDFLAHISLNPHTEQKQHPGKQDSSGQQQQADALTISTIHAAKGLEYNTVWVARWIEGFLPCSIRKADIEGLQEDPVALMVAEKDHYGEEQRLAHVAVTRAKERLILTRPSFAPMRQAPGSTDRQAAFSNKPMPLQPSRFLAHLEGLKNDPSVYIEIAKH